MTGLRTYIRRRRMFVIADATDNSMTLSKELFRDMGGYDMECSQVMVFKVNGLYAFTTQHGKVAGETALSEIQYNEKYKCIGFECNVPAVNRILYDYDIRLGKVKLTVRRKEIKRPDGVMPYYIIMPPNRRIRNRLNKLFKV